MDNLSEVELNRILFCNSCRDRDRGCGPDAGNSTNDGDRPLPPSELAAAVVAAGARHCRGGANKGAHRRLGQAGRCVPAPRQHAPRPLGFLHLRIMCLVGTVGLCQAAGWTDASKSVMTGKTSEYPLHQNNVKFPDSLTVRYKQPDAYHPKLRFWFTPDSFEDANTADGTKVALWKNVANICYPGHSSADCTVSKIANGENMAVEALKQSSTASQPVYKKGLINDRGAVRFTRSAVDGTGGTFLQMETTASSSTAGFTASPFADDKYTIFLVARTQPGITDTGQQGILNLAKAASDSTTNGLSLYKDSVVCLSGGGEAGLGCSGTTCPRCAASKYTTFGALSASFGETAVTDDNSCTSSCSAGCSLGSPPSTCSNLWGPTNTQNFQDADEWHVIALWANGATLKGYIDGYHASATPPVSVTAAAAATIAQMRLGIVDQADETNSGFGNVDIAEMLVYDTALTQQELDRIGNYLAFKFGLQTFRVNADVGSVTRTAAVSKNCGCSGGPPWVTCDNTKGPYCEAGVSLASGSCQSLDQTLKVVTGDSYLNLGSGIGAKSPSTGGNGLSIKGQFVLPSDVDRNAASGVFGTADYSTLDDSDTIITSQYLAVSVGHVPYACRAAYSTLKCTQSDFVETFASDCLIYVTATVGSVDNSVACASWVAPSPIPEIRCKAPPGIGAGQDLIIYWHGVPTVLSNWFHYEKPVVSSVVPQRVNVKGGTVTVKGVHFGSKASYTEKTQSSSSTYKAEVLILSRRQMKCLKTTWVSDNELICEVPPMPATRATDMDSNGR